MSRYYRPLAQTGVTRPADALALAGGWCWAERAEVLERGRDPRLIDVSDLPSEVVERISAPRAPVLGLALDRPRLMGILNVTPDSFSDGGRFFDPVAAQDGARALEAAGADLLDIGGESTRPGSEPVAAEEEMSRVVPLIEAVRRSSRIPLSIDTRKATVARAALGAGADMVNDVAALTFDPALGPLVAGAGVPVCLMHAKGDPKTMQDDPRYDDVRLDVYDFLQERVATAEAMGIPRSRIIVDPGIGFGKTVAHNLALIRSLSLYHGLGCAILLGASRKRFVGTLGRAPEPAARMPGSLAVALAAVQQGVQFCRVHDMDATKQAMRLYEAVTGLGTSK